MCWVINLQVWNKIAKFGEADGNNAMNKGFACIEFLKFYLNDCIYVCFGVCEERGLYFPPVSNV